MNERMGTPLGTLLPDASTASGGRMASVLLRDQQQRWEQGEPVPVEAYLRQHPALGEQSEELLDLICGEWAARERSGETIQLDEYVQRFPKLERSLRMQWEVHAVCRAMRRESSRPTMSALEQPVLITPSLGEKRANLPDVPGYEVLELIGHGGMGVVYKARHLKLNRLVALKMVRAGTTADRDELARFQREAEAVARLQHPNIVQIFEVGDWQPADGGLAVPYLSLEFVEGGSLAQRLTAGPQPPRAAAELLETLARAVECAHGQHIVHRDLKPANVLLTVGSRQQAVGSEASSSSLPTACCLLPTTVPKITDFGLAKRLDLDTEQTRTGAVMGTPSYMAPEQAEGRVKDVSRATDIYALGAILYEMLTGRPPFKGTSVLDTLEQVKKLEPVVPRRLQPGVPRDLDTICLKCLAKEPRKRYATAAALADDLRRFFDGKPIVARPTSTWEHVWKAAKRRPGVTVLLGVILAVAVAGFLGILNQWRRAEHNAAANWHTTFTFGINLAQQAIERNNTSRAVELLDSLKPQAGRADLRGFEWYYLYGLCHGDSLTLPGDCAAISPDGEHLATGSGRTITVCDRDGRKIAALHGHTGEVTALLFSPDGKSLVSAAKDKAIKIWDWRAGTETVRLSPEHTGWPLTLAMTADGRTVASGGRDGKVILWDLPSGKKQRTLISPDGSVTSLAFRPDGQTLVASTGENVWLWDLPGNAEPTQLERQHTGTVYGLAYSPDGRYLATAASDKTIHVWDAVKHERVAELTGHTAPVVCLAFSPTGRGLASGGWDRTIRVWDVASLPDGATPPLVLRGHRGLVAGLSFDRAGRSIVSAGTDHTARLWNLAGTPPESTRTTGRCQVSCFALSADGNWTATGGSDGIVRLWGRRDEPAIELKGHTDHINAVAFSADSRRLASGGKDGMVILWDVQAQQAITSIHAAKKELAGLAFRPDGRMLASCSDEEIIRLWDAENGEEIGVLRGHEGAVRAVAFSPDGKRLASAGADRMVRLWDVQAMSELQVLRGHADEVSSLAFDPQGKHLATGGKDHTVRLWDAASGELLFTLTGHDGNVNSVAFHPTDARRLATCGSPENLVKIWDLDTRQELLTLPGCAYETTCLAFQPDGEQLTAGGGTPQFGQLKSWSAAPGHAAAPQPADYSEF